MPNLFGFNIRLPRLSKKERRRATRERLFEELLVDYKSAGHPKVARGEARDISVTGIRFVSHAKFPNGTFLDLLLRFTPGSARVSNLTVQARVVRSYKIFRSKSYRIGCEFINLDPNARDILKDFVAWAENRRKKYLHFRYKIEE